MASLIFTLEDGNEIEAELLADTVTIGRDPESDIALPSESLSMNHATIQCRGGFYFVLDHGTTNGTTINGIEVGEAKLEDGDNLYFGEVAAIFQNGLATVAEMPTEMPIEAEMATVAEIAAEVPISHEPARLAVQPRVRRGMRRSYSVDTSSQSGGCSGFIAILVFIIMAFAAGLFARHYAEHPGRFLLTDVMQFLHQKYYGADPAAPAKKED